MTTGTAAGTASQHHREPHHGTDPLTSNGTGRNRTIGQGVCSPLPIGGTTRPDVDDVLGSLGYHRPAWQADALCREYPELPWHPARGESPTEALRVCGRCMVRTECLAWAMADVTLTGVLGGTTGKVRRASRARGAT